MNAIDIELYNRRVELAKIAIDAMREQRLTDARLIKEYADQMPDNHPAKKYLYEVSDTLIAQVIK